MLCPNRVRARSSLDVAKSGLLVALDGALCWVAGVGGIGI